MALNEGRQDTDVWSSPGWLRATAQGHGRLARLARERIKELQQEQQFDAGHRQQAEQFAAAHAQRAAEFRESRDENTRRAQETAAFRQLQQQQLADSRRASQEQAAGNARDRRSIGLLNMAQSGDPSITPEMKKSLLNMYLQSITEDGSSAPAGRTTLDALQGGQTPNPAEAAVRNQIQASGETVTPQTAPTTTNAPAPVPQRGNVAGVPQRTGGGGMAPSDLAEGGGGNGPDMSLYPPGTYLSGDASQTPMIGGSPAIPSNRLIQHGTIVGGPKGYDLNTNTGEWIPQRQEGTINGVPAGLSNAKSAMALGWHTPESASGQRAMQGIAEEAKNRRIGEATTPPMDITAPAPPRMGGNQPHTAMDFGDITTPKTAAAGAAPVAPTGPAGPNLPPNSFQPMLGQTMGGGLDRMFGIGGATAPAPAPQTAAAPQMVPPMLPGAVPPEESPAIKAYRAIFGGQPQTVAKRPEDQ